MKSLFLAVCLLSAHPAFAALCSEAPRHEPCTPDRGENTETVKKWILGRIMAAQELTPKVEKLKAEYVAATQSTADKEKLFAAYEPYYAQKMAQNHLYKVALDKTAELYHVSPDEEKKTVANPYDPALEWMSGLQAKWDPQVTDSGPGLKFAFKIAARDRDHYGGSTDMNPSSESGLDGMTLPDGRVFILAGVFDIVLKSDNGKDKGNPGVLASVLYHESQHFNHLSRPARNGSAVNRSWASVEEEERDAYEAQAAAEKIFELSKRDSDRINALRDYYIRAAKIPKTSYNDNEKGWRELYENPQKQINLEEKYQELKADAETARKERKNTAAAETDARRERDRVAADAQSKNMTADAVKECGFEPVFEHPSYYGPDWNRLYFVGFKPTGANGLHLYNFPSAKTISELKVSLMLARTCAAVSTGRTEQVGPPCNDGIAILNAHATDAAFLNRIDAQVTVKSGISAADQDQVYTYPCVADKLAQIRFPLDLKQYARLFESEAKRNVKLNNADLARDRNDAEQWRRRETGSQEPANGGRRSNSESTTHHCAASRGGVCVWWTD